MISTFVLLLLSTTVSDDGCGLDEKGRLRCFDLGDHCVSAPPADAFRSFDTVEGSSGCGLRTDGTVKCWGTFAAAAKLPKDFGVVEQLAVSKPHACVRRATGAVRCWGDAYQGSLDAPADLFRTISVGHSVSCGVRQDGTLACWGWEASGRLKPPSGVFKDVSVGLQAACALKPSGQLQCWGDLSKAPTGTFTSVAVGQFSACALRDDGSAVCFDASGQPKGVGPKGTTFSEVQTRCGRRRDGSVACWAPAHPEVLLVDDGLTVVADANGACAVRSVASADAGPLAPRRPWVDQAMAELRAGKLDTEGGRDRVRKEDLPHFAMEYRKLTSWRQKSQLVFLLCDHHDPALADMMWDALDVPEASDSQEVLATALSYLDGDFARFSAYLNDARLTKETRARRLKERAAKRAP